MTLSAKDVIAYWHTSLADATLPTLDPSQGLRVALADLSEGTLSENVLNSLFESEDPEKQTEDSLDIIVVPFIAQKAQRGRSSSKAKFVCPVLIPAQLTEEGTLSPTPEEDSPWIPRQWLEPVASGVVLGSVDALEDFLTTNLLSLPGAPDDAWQALLIYAQKMLERVSEGEWRTALEAAGYQFLEDALIVQGTQTDSFNQNVTAVYDQLIQLNELPELLQTYTRVVASEPEPFLTPEKWKVPAKKHLGSFGNETALSPSQREALYHSLSMTEGEVLAVSGPPGTGKTTLLQSVVASAWVGAALEQRDVPVIVATSTNNQAVTNVLDSFAKTGQVQRWLPKPVQGFGLYLTNSDGKQKDALKRGIHVVGYKGGFPKDIEDISFVHQAKRNFLRECSSFFGTDVHSVDEATNKLHKRLVRLAMLMFDGLDHVYQLKKLREQAASYGSLSKHLNSLGVTSKQSQTVLNNLETVKTAWLQHLNKENWFSRLFKKRLQEKRRLFWRTHLLEISAANDHSASLEQKLAHAKSEAQQIRQKLDEATLLHNQLQQANHAWARWCSEVEASLDAEQLYALETLDGETNEACLHNWLDTHLRFDLFVLSTHYFEGRWLQEVSESSILEPDHKPSWVRLAQTEMEKWRRYAMLTPCFVTTMQSGPAFFDYRVGESKALFGFIDLLIIDEAGQVAPQVSAGMVALARKALVVGDTKQLEPVWGITEKVDLANLRRHHLWQDDESLEQVSQAGITASAGSVMQLAKTLSKYQKQASSGSAYERGMFLAEHYRCAPEIIAYCNELAYGGRLKPKRKAEDHPWPRLGYVHVKGSSLTDNGSRYNEREAQTLAAWVVANREALLKNYEVDNLDKVIGVVTPFKAQAKAIRKILRKEGIDLEKVGTVHTLQGAERRLILFSSVYTSRDRGSFFFDRGVNMLNVAVSRAQDSFFVFGDMDIFDPVSPRPSGLLARHLFTDQRHEIEGLELPQRPSVKPNETVQPVRDLDTHRAVLSKALKTVEETLIIVSPFLRERAVADDRVCSKIEAAITRGAKVIIYTDDGFNENLELPSAKRAAAALVKSGAKVKMCHNIHSKIICIDEKVFVEGSFNWLSASRTEKYARYDYSLIYMGELVSEFTEETLQDLEQRVVKMHESE